MVNSSSPSGDSRIQEMSILPQITATQKERDGGHSLLLLVLEVKPIFGAHSPLVRISHMTWPHNKGGWEIWSAHREGR